MPRGALLAVVGGRDAEESKLNRAIQSRRQTGSLFKPFIYATFFQQGNSADTRISDDRIAYGEIRGAANWSPPQFGRNVPGHEAGLLRSHPFPQHHVRAHRQPRRLVQCHSIRTTGGLSRKYFPHPGPLSGHVGSVPSGHRQRLQRFCQRGVRPTPYIIDHITDSQGQPRFAITKSKRTVYSPAGGEHNLFHPPAGLQARRHGRKNYRAGL